MQIGNPLDISSEDKSPLAFANAQNEKNILRRVVRAVHQNDTLLAFQPIVKSVEPNSILCFEGLVRIREASGQIIPASKFMPLIEELEIARTIDCHALALGLRRLRARLDITNGLIFYQRRCNAPPLSANGLFWKSPKILRCGSQKL